jgi:hypothetical protein
MACGSLGMNSGSLGSLGWRVPYPNSGSLGMNSGSLGSLGWRVPYPERPGVGNVGSSKIGDARSGEMSAAPSSSSDGTGAVSFAGVEAKAPGPSPGAAPGAGEAALAAAEG